MKTAACTYLLQILETAFSNCDFGGVVKFAEIRVELAEAVEGIEDLIIEQEQRLDQQKALMVALEARLERLEARR